MYIIYMMHIKYIHRLLGVLKSIHNVDIYLLPPFSSAWNQNPSFLSLQLTHNSDPRGQLLIQRGGVGRAEDPLARLTIHLFRKAYGVA